MSTRREDCQAADLADPLAELRSRFLLPEGVIYLDGNSLGALPRLVPERIEGVVRRQWGEGLIRSWNTAGWVDLPTRVGERLGRLLGAEPGSVVACDSTSVNLFKAASAAVRLRPERRVVLTDTGNFPTDVYVLAGLAETLGRPLELRLADPDELVAAIDPEVAVVAVTQVDYRTGRMHDLAEVTAAAHGAGAVMVWDLAHSAGALPVDLAGANVDLAVGCGYKYLNGGPGAPAFIYVAPRHLPAFRNPISGWFGHARPFDFSLEFVPAEGIDRARVGTPHVLSLTALDAALDVFEGVDLQAVRDKSVALTELFIRLVEERASRFGFQLVTPRDPARRGSQVSFRHPDGYPVMQALIERGVIGDFRAPDVMRFGFTPLYLRFVEVWDAVETLVEVMETEAWRDPRYSVRAAVT